MAAGTVSIVLHIQVKIAAAYREASDCAVRFLAMTVQTVIWRSRAGCYRVYADSWALTLS